MILLVNWGKFVNKVLVHVSKVTQLNGFIGVLQFSRTFGRFTLHKSGESSYSFALFDEIVLNSVQFLVLFNINTVFKAIYYFY